MSNSPITFNGSVPQHYDDYLGPFLFEPYALDLLERIDTSNVVNALELACGTGRVTSHLLDHLPNSARLIATDLNADMIAVASKKITAPNLNWATVDLSTIPYADKQFDLIVCQYGLMFVPDKLKALTEIHRVLANNGKLIFNTWARLSDNPVWDITNTVVTSFIGNNPIIFDQGPFSMDDEKAVLSWLEQAGFSHAAVSVVPKTGHIETAALAAKGFVRGLPIYKSIQAKDPALLPEIEEKLEQEFIRHLGDKPLQSPLSALVFDASN